MHKGIMKLCLPIVTILFLLAGEVSYAAVNPNEVVAPRAPVLAAPSTVGGAADDKKKQEDRVQKKKKECDDLNTAREAKCTAATGNIRFESDAAGRYQCLDKKLPPQARLRVHVPGAGEPKCVSQSEATAMTGNPACSNERGTTNTSDPATCVNPTFEVTTAFLAAGLSAQTVQGAGIRCFQERTTQVGGRPVRSYFICGDPEDQKKFQNLTRQASLVPVASSEIEPGTAGVREPVAVATTEKPKPIPVASDVIRREPVAADVVRSDRPVAADTIRVDRPVAGDTIRRDQPVASTDVPYTTPRRETVPFDASPTRQQPTGVQTGRQDDFNNQPRRQPQYNEPIAQSAQSKSSSWLSSWLSPKQESQQQPVIVVNNNQPQPWFVAEMKRMEDARARAEAERKLLAEKMRSEKESKTKTQKDNEKKLVKTTISTKKSETDKDEKDEREKSQALFLKALMDAPSLEEVAKQYEEEQKKEEEKYKQQEQGKVVIAQKQTTGGTDKKTEPSNVEQEEQEQKYTRPLPLKRSTQAYSDVTPSEDTQVKNVPRPKSSLVSMLDNEAIRKGIPAPRIEDMPLPEKIAFTRTSYTVIVPTVRTTIKTIMRAYQKETNLSQLERDRHAAQLMALSEQLAGSAYGADYDTTQVLNDAARATELTAFMVAEYAESKVIENSLYAIFSTLTPLTKSQPVALTPPSGSVNEWSEQHFALIKYKIETAMEDTQNQKARDLYMRALSLVKSAELYKDSDQQYWNSSADIKEAVRTLSLATALDRASRASEIQESDKSPEQKIAEEKAKARAAILNDKGAEKGIWGSFLNMLGL